MGQIIAALIAGACFSACFVVPCIDETFWILVILCNLALIVAKLA